MRFPAYMALYTRLLKQLQVDTYYCTVAAISRRFNKEVNIRYANFQGPVDVTIPLFGLPWVDVSIVI